MWGWRIWRGSYGKVSRAISLNVRKSVYVPVTNRVGTRSPKADGMRWPEIFQAFGGPSLMTAFRSVRRFPLGAGPWIVANLAVGPAPER